MSESRNLDHRRSHRREIAIVLPLIVLAGGAATADSQSYAERLATGAFTEWIEETSYAQGRAALNTFFGRPDLNDSLGGISRPSTDCRTDGAGEAAGAQWVLASAAEARVVMFNENHYGVEARAFVRQLLGELRNAGFTHIGFEAFSPEIERAGRVHTPAEGSYTVEPVFAALVRDAATLGYEIFGYESTARPPEDASITERIDVREQAQAANLEERIGSEDGDARFIIFAGWSHIAEEPVDGPDGPLRWMAARLKQETGIDPLTVDLTGCVYTAAEPEGWHGRIHLAEDGTPLVSGQYSGAVDAQVHLPVPAADHPDPAGFFRSSLGGPVPVPVALRLDDAPVLVQAYRLDQQAGEVAFDRILLGPDEQFPLYLQAGSYTLIAHRGDGNIVGRATIEVD